MSTTHNLDRLPQWAQNEITNLRATVARLTAERNAGPDDTETYVDHITEINAGDEVQYQRLPSESQIVFWDQPGWPRCEAGRVVVNWNHRLPSNGRPGLEIRSSGAGRLVVMPWSANVIHLYEDHQR